MRISRAIGAAALAVAAVLPATPAVASGGIGTYLTRICGGGGTGYCWVEQNDLAGARVKLQSDFATVRGRDGLWRVINVTTVNDKTTNAPNGWTTEYNGWPVVQLQNVESGLCAGGSVFRVIMVQCGNPFNNTGAPIVFTWVWNPDVGVTNLFLLREFTLRKGEPRPTPGTIYCAAATPRTDAGVMLKNGTPNGGIRVWYRR